MAQRDPERPAHGLKIRFDDSGVGSWAWVSESHEVGPREWLDREQEPEPLNTFGDNYFAMWVASADPALADDRWFCVGVCSGDVPDMREALRDWCYAG